MKKLFIFLTVVVAVFSGILAVVLTFLKKIKFKKDKECCYENVYEFEDEYKKGIISDENSKEWEAFDL